MKVIYTLVIAVLLITASSAFADERRSMQTSYCSAAASDGVWAVFYGPYDIRYNCQRVKNFIRSKSFAPIDSMKRGYLYPNQYVSVRLKCWEGSRIFTGYGKQPFDRAFRYAKSYNAQGCIFSTGF